MNQQAEIIAEDGYWSVYFKGWRVMHGESYTVASNLEYYLNGGRLDIPTETEEIGERILA